MGSIHISVGAGFENDRRDLGVVAAQALSSMESDASDNNARYLIFECLAERTLAKQVMANSLESQIKLARSHLEPSRELCKKHRIRVVTNLGGIDPVGVANGLKDVFGDDCVIASVTGDQLPVVAEDGDNVLAKNCYIGAKGIASALKQGADIVVTGRVADPSLVVGPVVYELGLDWTNWNAIANATLAGHLIECGTQVSGGYFSDENNRVPNLTSVGPPVATVSESTVRLSKPKGGGLLSRATVIEQMLYEIGDPSCYITPDVVLDLSYTEVIELEENVVELRGAKGHPAPANLKSLLCRHTGWFAEGSICYYGTTSEARANLAKEILKQRIDEMDARYEVLHGQSDGVLQALLRVAFRSKNKWCLEAAMNELEALYLNGPAAGGGVRTQIVPQVDTEESYVSRNDVPAPGVVVAR